jgi:Glyoxalase-like domain
LGFIIDCPNPMKLAAFYSEVTGRPIMDGSGDNMAGITFGEVDLAFQQVEDYRPPGWPDDEHPKQYHLDFEVDEIELGWRPGRWLSRPMATSRSRSAN